MTGHRDASPERTGVPHHLARRRLTAVAAPTAAALAVLVPLQASALWSTVATPAAAHTTPFGVAMVGQTPWFTEQDGNAIATVNPNGSVTSYTGMHAAASPKAVVYDQANNALWFAEQGFPANAIGRFDLTTHAITETTLPTANAGPVGVTLDATGNIWFTETSASKIGKLVPCGAGGCAVTEYTLPTANAAPLLITTGPGNTLWWTERDVSKIGWTTLTAGVPGPLNEIPVPTASSQPYGIAQGPDGNMWFTEHLGNKVAKINVPCATGGGANCVSEYLVATSGSAPAGIVAGPDGNMWFTEQRGNKVAKIHIDWTTTTPSPLAGEFLVSRPNAGPNLIAAASDRLWFAESGVTVGTTVVPGESVVGATIGMSGYYNDGYGGLHPWWSANSPQTPQMTYAPGDGVYSTQIIKALAMRQDGVSGYTMDVYGGLHGFATSTSVLPPYMTATWSGFPSSPLARGVALCPDESGGDVVDAYGGLHPFTAPGATLPGSARSDLTSYWPGQDYARGVVLTSCSPTSVKGYVLDLYGGISPFATGGPANFPPRFVNIGTEFGDYYPGHDLARAIVLRPYAPTATPSNPNGNGVSGYTLDAWGGDHPVGTTAQNIPPSLATNGAYYPGRNLVVGLSLAGDGSNAWSVDVYGGVHVLGPVNGLNNPRTRDYYPGNAIITNIGGIG